ncbi:MAG TPA: hypothetical protein VJ047_19170 [Pseudomonas sp.]|nr:hypothetical protein [Pseudomonas sp.]
MHDPILYSTANAQVALQQRASADNAWPIASRKQCLRLHSRNSPARTRLINRPALPLALFAVRQP